jgi:uncharacterized protein
MSETQIAQSKLARFLSRSSAYLHRPRQVQVIQTHASWVFVAAPFVYKLKKPVNFGFLDFSTLEKRRHYTERELELNRRLGGEIYLEVLPVFERAGRFTFKGPGEAVEYLLKMKRLSPAFFLKNLLFRGKAGRREIDRVAQKLARFYLEQESEPQVSEWGEISKLRISTDENFRQARMFAGKTVSSAGLGAIQLYTERCYRGWRRLFARRVGEGRILDCHGDLHLDHIHITPRTLHIYDCIEFNDRLRYIDVANDIGFLAMDLDFHGYPELGSRLVEKMAKLLADSELSHLVNFYKCYRAFVRGKVESLQMAGAEMPPGEVAQCQRQARQYFRLALRYAIGGPVPIVIMVMGRVGSGKSSLARALGDELEGDVHSSDAIRKHLANAPLFARIGKGERGRLYSRRMSERTYRELLKRAMDSLAGGRCTVIDATFSRKEDRRSFFKEMEGAGYEFYFIEALAGKKARERRLKTRDQRGGEISDARAEDMPMLDALYDPPQELSSRLIKVNTSGKLDSAVSQALDQLVLRQFTILPGR